MDYFLLACTAFFAISITLPEIRRRHQSDYRHEPISHYLTGPGSTLQDVGFIVMAVGLFHLARALGLSVAGIAAALVGAGVLGAMVTDRFPGLFGRHKTRWHIGSAALAFLAAAPMMLATTEPAGLLGLGAAYLCLPGLCYLLAPRRTSVQEKLATATIILWLLAYAIIGG